MQTLFTYPSKQQIIPKVHSNLVQNLLQKVLQYPMNKNSSQPKSTKTVPCLITVLTALLLISVPFAGWAEDQVIPMNVAFNHSFSISPPESDASGEWVLHSWDNNALKLIENGDRLGKRYFVFKPESQGTTTIHLEFILNEQTTDRIIYKITVNEPTSNPSPTPDNTVGTEAPSTVEDRNTQESALYDLIDRLYQRRLYTEALSYINQYEALNNSGSLGSVPNAAQRLTDVLMKKANIILSQHDIHSLDDQERQEAVAAIEELIADRSDLVDAAESDLSFNIQTGNLMYQLAQIQEHLNQWDEARTTYIKILTFFDEQIFDRSDDEATPVDETEAIERLSLQAHLGLAKTYYNQHDFETAFTEFEPIADKYISMRPEQLYSDSVYIHARAELEDILFFLARLYTIQTPYMDYNKAFELYRLLASDSYFPGGRYQMEAQRKMTYLNTNFLDYR